MPNYLSEGRRSIFLFKIPNPFKFLGDKQRAIGVYAAGAFVSIAGVNRSLQMVNSTIHSPLFLLVRYRLVGIH